MLPKLRTRTKSFTLLKGEYTELIHYRDGRTFSSPFPNRNSFPYGEQQIMIDEDNEGKPFNKDSPKFRYVWNNKSSIDIDFQEFTHINSSEDVFDITIKANTIYYWGMGKKPVNYLPGSDFTTPSFTSEELWSAIGRMEPSAEKILTEFNLWTFVLELSQLKQLLGVMLLKAGSLTKEIATKHLEWNFGVVPLSKDMSAIYSIFSKIDNEIDAWNRMAYNGQAIDFHEYISSSEDVSTDDGREAARWTGSGYCDYEALFYKKTISRVHCYGTPLPIPDNKRFKVFIQALGIDKPLSGAWEAVPFSWFVDYFTNVGDFISRWEHSLDSLFKMKLVSAGYSTKTEYHINVKLREYWTYPWYMPGLFLETEGSEKGTLYKRVPLPHNSLFQDARKGLQLSNKMKFELSAGWKQGSYVAAVAYLLTSKKG